jgi:hypothetical protein
MTRPGRSTAHRAASPNLGHDDDNKGTTMDAQGNVIDNEDRADLGVIAVMAAATLTGVAIAEEADTAICDVISYIAHLCDRLGLDPAETFADGLESYDGDFEDKPRAAHTLNADRSLEEQLS